VILLIREYKGILKTAENKFLAHHCLKLGYSAKIGTRERQQDILGVLQQSGELLFNIR